MNARLHPDEQKRLAVLHELDLLDTEPEAALDALTRLTASLLGVPIAVVSLVDASRQWFKSKVGLDANETPREVAFCAHAILEAAPFVVEDAQDDGRFFDNPLVTGAPHIRAYAGVPLTSLDGLPVGTLCAIDRRPRRFTASELQTLRDLATIANREIDSRERTARAKSIAHDTLKAVEDSEKLYRATVDHAGIGIAVVALDGSWLRINPMMCEILGRSEPELKALTFQDITHPEDLNEDLGLVRQLLDGAANSYKLEKRYIRPDGSTVWGNLTVTVVRGKDHKPSHFVSLVEDITQRKETEDALRKLRLHLEQRVIERTQDLQRANHMLGDTVRQLRESERALEESRTDLSAVLTHAHDAYICIDSAGLVIEWNRQAATTFGWPREEALGRRLEHLIIPLALRDKYRHELAHATSTGNVWVLNRRLQLTAIRRDGMSFPCELTITELPSQAHGKVYAAFLHDISERKRAERELGESNLALERLNREQSLMLDNELIGIVKLKDRTATWTNRAFERLFGYEPGEAVGQGSRRLYADQQSYEETGLEMYAALKEHGTYRAQLELLRKDGRRIWVDVSGALLSSNAEESLWMMQDISAMKRHQQVVEEMAFKDGLTGLPTRQILMDRLELAMASIQRTSRCVAAIFADLNGFKAVNDTHGHVAGDELLKVIARRLQDCIRPYDTVTRFGGDEFVLLLTDLGTEDAAEVIVERAAVAIARPVQLSTGVEVVVGASIGVAFARRGETAAKLLARADAAMYAKKRLAKHLDATATAETAMREDR